MKKKFSIILILIVLLLVIIIFPSIYLKNTDDIEDKIGSKTIYTIADLFKYSYLELAEPKIDFICNIEDNFSIENDICHIEVESHEDKNYLISCYLEENEIETINLINKAELDVELNEGKNIVKIEIKDGENIVKTWEREIAYIKPYEKQFLDECGQSGVVVHLLTLHEDQDNQENNIKLWKNLGIQYVRIEIKWEIVDKNGQLDFSQYDEYMKKIETSGIKPIVILGAPRRLAGTDMAISNEEELNRYLNYAVAVCKQYPFVQYYEIWNEPNFHYDTEDGVKWYSRMVNEVSKRFKAINKDIQIIGGATTLTPYPDFLEKMTENGTLLTSDSYSFHLYDIRKDEQMNATFEKYISQHEEFQNDIGGFQHFDITESGLSTNTADGIDEQEQALREVQQSIMADEYDIQKFIIYNFKNPGEVDSREYMYGIVRLNYIPKLSYYALKNYNENTNGAEYMGRVNLANGLVSYLYNKDGNPKIITWSSTRDDTITINYQDFEAKDLYGNKIENTNGTLTITNSPVYLDNISIKYFYEAISNTALEKYAEFEEKFSLEIGKVDGLQEQINKLKDYMTSIKNNESETQDKAIEMMHEHFYLGTMVLDAFNKDKLNVEYVKVSSMLDMLNDIGDSYEDLLTVSATSREAYYTATEELINKAETTINNNSDLNIVYPSKILDFAKELHEKSEYIIGLEEENDIKTGLIVSNSLHAYYLADWANDFANIYVNKYIKQNPITVSYSNTDEYTNQDVTVTLNIGSDSKVTNNEGNNIYTFTHNGTFTFEYERRGQAFEEKVTVTSIDKEAPTISGVVNGKIYTDSAKPVIKDDNLEKIEVLFNGTNIQFNSGNTLKDEGIYNITATDKAGNVTSVEIYIVEKGEEGYIIENGYILNVKQKTTINNFATKFNLSSGYTIKRNDKAITNKDIIATGDILQLKNGAEYTIVVAGDINKDGKVTTYDLSTFRRYILGLREFDELESLAADINVDKQALGVKDYTRMRIEILGEY